jgi:hypothetical protein
MALDTVRDNYCILGGKMVRPNITRFQVDSLYEDDSGQAWKVDLSRPVDDGDEVWTRLWDYICDKRIEYDLSVMDYYGDYGLQAYSAGEATPETFPKIVDLLREFLVAENLLGSEKIEPITLEDW